MLDLVPLTPYNAYLSLIVLSAVAVLLALSKKYRIPYLLLAAPRPGVWYAGTILAVSIALAASFVVEAKLAAGLSLATLLLIIVGRRDEQSPLSPRAQLCWQAAIAALAVGAGWSISHVTHPAGEGIISLAWLQLGPIALPAALITVIWLVVLMNALNWLDGTDGLASGVATAGFLVLAAVSLLPQIQSSTMLALAGIGAAATLAFTIWNWSPATIFLGTVGSWMLGLYLGLVGLTGGGKIITTAIILAWPVCDSVAVVVQRLQRRQPLWQGDRHTHLHFRLQAAGLSPASIAALAIGVTLAAGAAALLLSTPVKMVLLLSAGLLVSLVSLRAAPQANNRPSKT